MSDPAIEIINIATDRLGVILDLSFNAIPRIVYWGASTVDLSTPDLRAAVLASREAFDGNSPDEQASYGIIPLESDAWKGRPGLSGHRDDGTAWSPRFKLVDITLPEDSQIKDKVASVSNGELHFRMASEISELELNITIAVTMYGMLKFKTTLKNLGVSPYQLDELGICLPLPLEANEILDTAGRWGKERVPQRRPVVIGCDLREGRHGRTGFDAPGFTYVGPEGFNFRKGEVWGLHTAWSGNHRTWVEKLLSGEQVIGASELLLPGETVLRSGESYDSPWFFAIYADGLDSAAQNLHAWYRQRPQHPRTPRPVTLNVWEAVYFDHNLETLQKLATTAAQTGVERFVLDDGWFLGRRNDKRGLGDWFVDPQVWPEGLTPLSDLVHRLGMQFGLWFEPEMINPDSELARKHPDWIMAAQGSSAASDLPVEWRHQQVLNITVPEAYSYIKDRIITLVKEYEIDYIKWDHNRDLIEAGNSLKRGCAAVSEQTRQLYRLLDEIKSQCPGLEIESCSSGGGRVDLEILQHTDRFWASDCIDPVERQQIVRWFNQVAPPELMGTHVASGHSHTTGRWAPLSMRAGTALWGSFGIEWNLLEATDDELGELEKWVAYYKANRDFLHTSNLVRCNTPDESIWLDGVVNAKQSRALFQMVTRERSVISPRGKLKFSGLNPDFTYIVRPIIVGNNPSGLVAPLWFNQINMTNNKNSDLSKIEYRGIAASGDVLMKIGVQTPRLNPDQTLLFEITQQ